MIPVWLRNAYVGAVCYTGNRARKIRLMEELARVGIHNANVTWSFPSPYRDIVLKSIPHIRMLSERPGCWGATLTHYKILKTAYELGYSHAFIVEDDCRFLKDVHQLWNTVSLAPNGWDMLLLDSFTRKGAAKNSGNGWFSCASAESTACYAVTRKAMARLIDLYESPVSGKFNNPMMRNSDHWTNTRYLGTDVKFYVAYPNLAVQCPMGDRTNCGDYVFRQYSRMHLNKNLYEM